MNGVKLEKFGTVSYWQYLSQDILEKNGMNLVPSHTQIPETCFIYLATLLFSATSMVYLTLCFTKGFAITTKLLRRMMPPHFPVVFVFLPAPPGIQERGSHWFSMGRAPLNPSDAFESFPLKQSGIQDANLNPDADFKVYVCSELEQRFIPFERDPIPTRLSFGEHFSGSIALNMNTVLINATKVCTLV